jgi:hypothetical protein
MQCRQNKKTPTLVHKVSPVKGQGVAGVCWLGGNLFVVGGAAGASAAGAAGARAVAHFEVWGWGVLLGGLLVCCWFDCGDGRLKPLR